MKRLSILSFILVFLFCSISCDSQNNKKLPDGSPSQTNSTESLGNTHNPNDDISSDDVMFSYSKSKGLNKSFYIDSGKNTNDEFIVLQNTYNEEKGDLYYSYLMLFLNDLDPENFGDYRINDGETIEMSFEVVLENVDSVEIELLVWYSNSYNVGKDIENTVTNGSTITMTLSRNGDEYTYTNSCGGEYIFTVENSHEISLEINNLSNENIIKIRNLKIIKK